MLWNGVKPTGVTANPLKLTPDPGTLVILDLKPSDTLWAKTNQLRVTLIEGANTPKVFIKAEKTYEFFPGSEFIKKNNAYPLKFLKPEFINVALSLACVNEIIIPPAKTKHPESAKHVKEAQALGLPRIVTVDRLGTDARRNLVNKLPAMITCRATNKLIYPNNDCDEYPQAVFKENNGTPSIKTILSSDNRGSGSKIGYYLGSIADNDQVEVVVPNANLYCKPAF